MVENPVLELKIKYFFLCTWLSGQALLVHLEFYIIKSKTTIATLMAQGGVIVQITYCLILKYKEIITLKCFSSNISVKAKERKMEISIE